MNAGGGAEGYSRPPPHFWLGGGGAAWRPPQPPGSYTYDSNYTINAVSFHYLWYGAISDNIYTDKTLTLRKCVYNYMRASAVENFRISRSKTVISFNILLVLQILCRYKITCLSTYIMGIMVPPGSWAAERSARTMKLEGHPSVFVNNDVPPDVPLQKKKKEF